MPDFWILTLSGALPGQGQREEVGNFQMSLLGHFTPPSTMLASFFNNLPDLHGSGTRIGGTVSSVKARLVPDLPCRCRRGEGVSLSTNLAANLWHYLPSAYKLR
jgi:hypothetical protein